MSTEVKSQRSDPKNTPNAVRVAYPYFHEKRTENAGKRPYVNQKTGEPNPRYAGTLMFPKLSADPHQCANYLFLWALAVEAARKMWPTNVDAAGTWTWPTGAQLKIQDGDIPYVSKPVPGQPVVSPEEKAKKNAWRVGYWIVEVESFFGLRISKLDGGQIIDLPAREINGVLQYKGGDWGYPNIHAWAYQNETFGVNFGFEGFCFTREGEAIGSSGPKSATQMFGNLPGVGAPVAGQVAPTAHAPFNAAGPMPTHAAPPVAPVAPPPMPTHAAAPIAPPPPAAAMALPPIPGR